MRNRSVIRQFIFIRIRLFKKRMYRTRFELIRENTRSKRERLMIVVIVGRRAEVHFFSRVDGIGSRSQ